MPVYEYAIGTSNPPTNLESLTVPVNPPRGRFFEAGVWLDKADGNQRGQGFPTARWEFDELSQAMVTQLRSFCSGQSASVYIKTRKNDGTFAIYSAIMLWPSDQMDHRAGANANATGLYTDLVFNFRRLQAV